MKRAAILLLASALLLACRGKQEMTTEVVIVDRPQLVLDPSAAEWSKTPRHVAPLLLQDLVEPRLMKASTPAVDVEAMTDGKDVAFRLSWADESPDEQQGVARFADACALQLPRKSESDLPAPQMGEPGRPVEITLWRASWQAIVDGKRTNTIKDIHPRASVDHYPFQAPGLKPGSPEEQQTAKRYAPAFAAGNNMAGPRDNAVQMLLAEGPGTLTPDATLRVNGKGFYDTKAKLWHVIIVRPLPDALKARGRSQAAFAVWQGASGESGGRKMRTGWIPLLRRGKES